MIPPPSVTPQRLLWAGLILLLFAVGGEYAVSRWLMRPQPIVMSAKFGYVQRPGSSVVQSREGWGEFTAESHGILDDEVRSGPGTTVGVLLGDSFGQGLQVRDDERFSEVAESLLPGVSILNAASAGRSPIHYALFAPRLAAEFRPDFLLMQVNDGDLNELEAAELWRGELAEFQSVGATGDAPVVRGRGPARLVRDALGHSGLLKMLYARTQLLFRQERTRLHRKFSRVPPDLRDVVAAPVSARSTVLADSLVGVVRAVEPRLLLVYVPHIAYFDSPPHVAYPERRGAYHALAARLGVRFVDPTDALLAAYARDREPLHGFWNSKPGEGHLNARGHAVVGRLVAAELARLTASGGAWRDPEAPPVGEAGR